MHSRPFSPGWIAVVVLDVVVIIASPLAGIAALGMLLILAGVTR